MRILHLGKFCPPVEGGIEIFTHDLLEYLNSKVLKRILFVLAQKVKKEIFIGTLNFMFVKLILYSNPLLYLSTLLKHLDI